MLSGWPEEKTIPLLAEEKTGEQDARGSRHEEAEKGGHAIIS